MSQLELFEEQS